VALTTLDEDLSAPVEQDVDELVEQREPESIIRLSSQRQLHYRSTGTQ
jgi:hypothetical protein